MKVLVIGATGETGRHLMPKLLARGDEVTAFARRPEAVTEKNPRLRVIQGDARDAGSIERAVQGQDAVLVAFGTRSLKKDDLQETFYRNLVSAMKKHGVKRVVNLSAWGLQDPSKMNPVFRILGAGLFLRNFFADKRRGEAILLSEGLDYVNVQPGRLLNKPARGGVHASLDGKALTQYLTREDLAEFMIEQLTTDAWLRKSPLVGYLSRKRRAGAIKSI